MWNRGQVKIENKVKTNPEILIIIALVIIAILVISLIFMAPYYKNQMANAIKDLKAGAEDFTLKYTNYTYEKPEKYYENLINSTTGQIQKEFQDEYIQDNLDMMKQLQVKSTGKIQDIVAEIDGDIGKAVAVVEVTTQNADFPSSTKMQVIYMILKKDGNVWKVERLEPY